MLTALTRKDLSSAHEQFREKYMARAAVFKDRLGWDVEVAEGLEIDLYDRIHDPVYLVTHRADGHLTGSLRLLPTTGETMLRTEFRDFFEPSVDIMSPTIWECTRFCVHPEVNAMEGRTVAIELLRGLCKLALASGIEHIVGVYEAAMLGVYRQIGWSPETLARSQPEVGSLMVGLWTVSEAVELELGRRFERVRSSFMADSSFHSRDRARRIDVSVSV